MSSPLRRCNHSPTLRCAAEILGNDLLADTGSKQHAKPATSSSAASAASAAWAAYSPGALTAARDDDVRRSFDQGFNQGFDAGFDWAAGSTFDARGVDAASALAPLELSSEQLPSSWLACEDEASAVAAAKALWRHVRSGSGANAPSGPGAAGALEPSTADDDRTQ